MAELKTDNGIPVPQWYDQELDDWVFYTNEYMKELLSKIESLQEELEGIKSAQTDGSQKVQVSGSEEFAQDVTVQEVKSELEAVKSELEAVKSGIETLKENQTSGDQKVQLSGTISALQTDLLSIIAYNTSTSSLKVSSWANLQHIVRAGLHHQVFQVGDQFMALFDGEPHVWDVIGIDHDVPTDKRFVHSLTIQSHDCLLNAQFDAPEPDNPDGSRQQYGNNRYLHSAIRQWLNSAETTFTWQPQHQYDVAPTGTAYDGAGFLKLLDPELVAVLGAVDKQVARNTVTDGGGQDLFSDKVFLLSRVEVYGGSEGETSGEVPYPYYESLASSPTTAALDGRIKYLGASARDWWLRSPSSGNAYYPRYVGTGGSVSHGFTALNSIGAAPACCII